MIWQIYLLVQIIKTHDRYSLKVLIRTTIYITITRFHLGLMKAKHIISLSSKSVKIHVKLWRISVISLCNGLKLHGFLNCHRLYTVLMSEITGVVVAIATLST